MDPEELSKIVIHAVPNSWKKQSYIQGWDFEGRSYKDKCDMFKCMEIVEAIYEGGEPSKNNQLAEADRAIFGRKKKGGWSASPSKPKKGHTGKRNKNNAGYPNYRTTGGKACLLHVPGTLWKSKN